MRLNTTPHVDFKTQFTSLFPHNHIIKTKHNWEDALKTYEPMFGTLVGCLPNGTVLFYKEETNTFTTLFEDTSEDKIELSSGDIMKCSHYVIQEFPHGNEMLAM